MTVTHGRLIKFDNVDRLPVGATLFTNTQTGGIPSLPVEPSSRSPGKSLYSVRVLWTFASLYPIFLAQSWVIPKP